MKSGDSVTELEIKNEESGKRAPGAGVFPILHSRFLILPVPATETGGVS
jgi:hypothetical protein